VYNIISRIISYHDPNNINIGAATNNEHDVVMILHAINDSKNIDDIVSYNIKQFILEISFISE